LLGCRVLCGVREAAIPPLVLLSCSFDGPLTYGGGSNARDYEAARISTTIETVRDAQDLVFTEWCNP
jgi:hypothetical protein